MTITDPGLLVDIDGSIFINTANYEVILNPDGTIDARRKDTGFTIKIIRQAVGYFINALINRTDEYMDGVFALLPKTVEIVEDNEEPDDTLH